MSKTIYVHAYRNLIARLREQRIRAGLMQSDVGKRLGVARSLIGKIERCEVRLDVVGLVRMARVYRTSARDLIAGLEKELSDEDGSFFRYQCATDEHGMDTFVAILVATWWPLSARELVLFDKM